MIRVIGAHGNIPDVDVFLGQIRGFAQDHHVVIQVFDADVIFGRNHLVSAVEHAVRAVKRNTNTTSTLGMEILLYASGERQLKLAIPKMGVKKGDSKIAFVLTSKIEEIKGKISDCLINKMLEQLNLSRDDSVLDGDRNTLRKFGINENEIKTVIEAKYGDLILEKVAMVDVIK